MSSCAVVDDKFHATDSIFDQQLSGVLQKILEKAAKIQNAENVSASLYISDRCHWEGTSGTTKQDSSVLVEPDMLYGFGSITKTFVAAIVLQLVEENKLRLDEPLENWLEKYPNIDSNITIRQLLNHGSGLYDYINDGDSFWLEVDMNINRVWMPEELLGHLGSPPEIGFDVPKYSNTNYILLGMVIEAATGRTLEQELQNRIIEPLQLNNTSLAKNIFDPNQWADNRVLTSSLYSGVWAAGAVASTSRDIAKWSHTLYSGKFLHASSLESMLVTEPRRYGKGAIQMGLGVWKSEIASESAWGHGGWIGYFLSQTFYIPKYNLSVAYVSTGIDESLVRVPGSLLVSAYIDNKPDDISMCFDS
ncbi:MAG: beta-lactamase family protein [Gammaproteobacteria bacterium]|nr:beta-lactamase family protein [Gammaproteobacteria bacterium]